MRDNINLMGNPIEQRKKARRKHGKAYKFFRFILYVFIAFFITSFSLSSKAIFSESSLKNAISRLPVVSQIKSLIADSNDITPKDEDRANFLIMGIGGEGHDGGLLTDTMMLVSVQMSTKQTALVSIPRDLYVKIPGNGYQRINHASAYGDTNNYPNGGSALAAATVEKTFGVPIHYYLRINFKAFKQIIDDIGGIDVYVDTTFTDNKYPTEDYLVQTISFKQGLQHMDGETALMFARSRHGNNGEGSDFARNKRQQKIILAVKDKILDWKTMVNPNKIYGIYDNIKSNIQTNIEPWQIPKLLKLLREIDFDNIRHYVIDDSPGGLLKPLITSEGAQVLAPRSGELTELKYFVSNLFVIEDIMNEDIKLIIANGTEVEGLATYTGTMLKSWGFTIEKLSNSSRQDYEKTVIYDLKNGEKEEALKILKTKMDANATDKIPDDLKELLYKTNDYGNTEKIDTDFLILVGLDQRDSIKALKEWQVEQARLETIRAMTIEEGSEEEIVTDNETINKE